MLQKLNYVDEAFLPDAIRRQRYEGAPHGNAPPRNLTRISEKDFAQSAFFSEQPEVIEYRQVRENPNQTMLALHIYWYRAGHGIAITTDYWAGTVQYFRCGCPHRWQQTRGQQCWNTYVCEVCGYSGTVDSSG